MKTNAKIKFLLLGFLVLTIIITGCKSKGYNNFTTYFNTFYNEERMMKECEEEFDFQAEKRRATPRILVPISTNSILNNVEGSSPSFLVGLRVDRSARQAVNTKLDSILAKGSKIIAKSGKNDYIVPSLYLMAKSFFYKEEWLASQIKCSELIDKDPVGKYSADAHLLLATNLLMQGKYEAGLTMLSRTVDVSWLNERYDILTQAFNIEAEMSLYYGDLEGAIRPYFQAIAQSDDSKQQAIWQNELAGILYRMRKYDRAEKAYSKVLTFKTDLSTEYEAKLYRANCLIRLGRDYEADRILTRLDDDGKFEEWKDYVATQRLIQTMLTGDTIKLKYAEYAADSLYPQSQIMNAYHYEKGLLEFEKGNFIDARSYIAKARSSRTPLILQPANKIFIFMNNREIALKMIGDTYQTLTELEMEKLEYEKKQELLNDTSAIHNSNEKTIDTKNNTTIDTDENAVPISENDINTTNTGTDIVTNAEEKLTDEDTIEVIEVPNYQEQIDRQRVYAAKFYYELARIHYSIGNIDSTNYYYKVAADIAPLSEPESSRYLYVYAESIRDTNAWKADSILNVIATTQPKSEYGKIALKQLGYTDAFIADTATNIYNSGCSLMKYKEYDFAKEKFILVYENYPTNLMYAPKSLYTLGFMYENYIQDFDSANKYYNILIEKYPESEYAKELSLALKFKSIIDSGAEIPDSLKTREVTLYTADTSIIHAPYDSTMLSKPKKDGFSFDDLKNPSKLLEKTKKKLQEQLDKAKEINSVIDSEIITKELNEKLEKLKVPKEEPTPESFKPKGEEPEKPVPPDIPAE
jgi:TolA-binding protein